MPAEGRGLWFKTDAESGEEPEIGKPSNSDQAFRSCRAALHAKAKEEPGYRFYALYDKVYRLTYWNMPMPAARPTRGQRG